MGPKNASQSPKSDRSGQFGSQVMTGGGGLLFTSKGVTGESDMQVASSVRLFSHFGECLSA